MHGSEGGEGENLSLPLSRKNRGQGTGYIPGFPDSRIPGFRYAASGLRLLDVVDKSGPSSEKARLALDALKKVKTEIDALKAQEYGHRADDLLAQVEKFSERGGDGYEELAGKLRGILGKAKP